MNKELKRLAKSLKTDEQKKNLISYLEYLEKENFKEYNKIKGLTVKP